MLPEKEATRDVISTKISNQKCSELGEDFARLQRALNKTEKSLLVIVDGWESSGKGPLLKDLTRELDPKYYEVSVFEESSAEEDRQPYLHRFFMKAPYEGQISFFDLSFYYELFNNPFIEGKRLAHLIDDIEFVEEAVAKRDTRSVKFYLNDTEGAM